MRIRRRNLAARAWLPTSKERWFETAERRTGDYKSPLLGRSHHFRVPGNGEEENEKKKPYADQDLDQAEDRHDPAKRRRSPNPVSHHAQDRDRLEDREEKIYDVRIVQMILVRQPAAGNQVPVNCDGRDEMSDRIQHGFHRERLRRRRAHHFHLGERGCRLTSRARRQSEVISVALVLRLTPGRWRGR